MVKSNRILIVGGAGYIGGYLVDHLVESCYRDYNTSTIAVYDNLTYENHYLKNVDFIFGDIRDRKKLAEILPNFDIVIWLAAIVGDGACAIDPVLTTEVNENSVKWLVDNYKGKIMFPSTCSVYGINHELISEDATPNPLSMYAKTKLNAEQYIIKNYDDYLIFRLGTLFGMGDSFSRIRLDLVVNVLTMKAVLGEELCVYGGEQWRPLLHVRDVAKAIEYCLNNNIKGLYNLSYENYKISHIAETIKEIFPNTKIKYVDICFEDLRNYKVSTDKILKTGWKPFYQLEDGIVQIGDIIMQNRIKNTNDVIYSNVAFIKNMYEMKKG